MQYDSCPCCAKKIQPKGLFGSNALHTEFVGFINLFTGNSFPAYCDSCKVEPFYKACANYQNELNENYALQKNHINDVPCINISSPYSWSYDILEIVTAQSTMGTGFISELSLSWNDFFGLESNTMNSKISLGEDNCMKMLRAKTIALGGNAVIGVDIDYAEVGALRGLIMVCATGTAVRVKNLEVFSQTATESIKILVDSLERMKELNKYLKIANSVI
ncbi:heavy metal-binding domain-containing protein [Emticicia sp. 17c]|uniref:heavy metal-binding domain-containing protein n=1 Tax=Emticicia sp. 17c TaxID=3127704 RepID=UPI00301D42DB